MRCAPEFAEVDILSLFMETLPQLFWETALGKKCGHQPFSCLNPIDTVLGRGAAKHPYRGKARAPLGRWRHCKPKQQKAMFEYDKRTTSLPTISTPSFLRLSKCWSCFRPETATLWCFLCFLEVPKHRGIRGNWTWSMSYQNSFTIPNTRHPANATVAQTRRRWWPKMRQKYRVNDLCNMNIILHWCNILPVLHVLQCWSEIGERQQCQILRQQKN